jgi:hypothetical protein
VLNKGRAVTARRQFLIHAITAMLVAGSNGRTLAAPASEKSFPLKLTRGSRLVVSVKIKGVTVAALLDYAAETSLLDRTFARDQGLIGGQAVDVQGSGHTTTEAKLIEGVAFETLGLKLSGLTVAIIDLSDVGRRLLGSRLDMIVGREVFDAARLQIDIAHRRDQLSSFVL